jgi:hypothetical protein
VPRAYSRAMQRRASRMYRMALFTVLTCVMC